MNAKLTERLCAKIINPSFGRIRASEMCSAFILRKSHQTGWHFVCFSFTAVTCCCSTQRLISIGWLFPCVFNFGGEQPVFFLRYSHTQKLFLNECV